MKTTLLFLSLTISLFTFAEPNSNVQGPVGYSCSKDNFSIFGTDGTVKSCWPYICTTTFDKESHAVCMTHCNVTDDCQLGTACEQKFHICIKVAN